LQTNYKVIAKWLQLRRLLVVAVVLVVAVIVGGAGAGGAGGVALTSPNSPGDLIPMNFKFCIC
jgi:hypothetical protein